MSEFSPDEARRWDAWQRANAISARRSDRFVQYVGVTLLAAAVLAVTLAAWR